MDICLLYLSDNLPSVERLAQLLRERWSLWWARDLQFGDWERAVRENMPECKVVVPVLSRVSRDDRMAILTDEMHLARRLQKPILPFLLSAAEMPLGFGSLMRTEAFGWDGTDNHPAFLELVDRLSQVLGPPRPKRGIGRPREMDCGSAMLPLPNFIFSLSSFETRIRPEDGIKLLSSLRPAGALVSAYDVHRSPSVSVKRSFIRDVQDFAGSGPLVILDSGNYEASHKDDYYRRTNRSGWRRELYHQVTLELAPDIAFHYDRVNPSGSSSRVAKEIVQSFVRDWRVVGETGVILCPIVHLPNSLSAAPAKVAAEVVYEVAKELRPAAVAIPERELGDGFSERVLAITEIRQALNRIGEYIPLHILGTGNPWTITAFSAAGADLFDGLEWCRTVADYQNGSLHHFHHLDLVLEEAAGRMQNQSARTLVLQGGTPYAIRTLAHNVDFFEDWVGTMRNLLHAGQGEYALRAVPRVDQGLFQTLFPGRGGAREPA